MKNIYVILGWSRTGSNWIVDMLCSRSNKPAAGIASAVLCYGKTPAYVRHIARHTNIVIHTHDKDFLKNLQLDAKDVTLIVSKRKDLFACLMSLAIARVVSKEFNGYTNKKLVPTAIDPREFVLWTLSLCTWYDSLDDMSFRGLPFKKIATVFYEDIHLYGHTHIMDAVGIDRKTPFTPAKIIGPSPYKYKEIILNWKDLFVIYEKISSALIV